MKKLHKHKCIPKRKKNRNWEIGGSSLYGLGDVENLSTWRVVYIIYGRGKVDTTHRKLETLFASSSRAWPFFFFVLPLFFMHLLVHTPLWFLSFQHENRSCTKSLFGFIRSTEENSSLSIKSLPHVIFISSPSSCLAWLRNMMFFRCRVCCLHV